MTHCFENLAFQIRAATVRESGAFPRLLTRAARVFLVWCGRSGSDEPLAPSLQPPAPFSYLALPSLGGYCPERLTDRFVIKIGARLPGRWKPRAPAQPASSITTPRHPSSAARWTSCVAR